MSTEIERKWVVPVDRAAVLKAYAFAMTTLEQGYLNVATAGLTVSEQTLLCAGERVAIAPETTSRLRTFIATGGLRTAEIRYRLYGSELAVLTIKGGKGMVRFEEEMPISFVQAAALKRRAINVVQKDRYLIKDGIYTLEMDIYHQALGFDFAALEVEFPNIEAANAYALPTTLQTVAKEVTHINLFKNQNLSKVKNLGRKIIFQHQKGE